MRIKQLDLKAFGSFTGQKIAFNSKSPGLHVIYGPNEAGKSSSLRALRALLYGFPERTIDNFNHANKQLLVGGTIEGSQGQELSFLRRKKRKADLLDAEGNPLDPDTLSVYLQGIEQSLFDSLFGIDHKTLVAGGEEILAQKGAVGHALFAAGTGLISLRNIIGSLETETSALFKDRGSTQHINKALKEYKDLKKEVKDACLLPGRWKEHERRLKNAEMEHSRLEKESKRINSEVHRLHRLRRAIPELAELENLQKQLWKLGDVVLLPEDFSDRVQSVTHDTQAIELQIERDKDRLKKLQGKQDQISLNPVIFDHVETIGDLYQRLGRYRKDQTDQIKLEGMRVAHRRDAGSFIEEISNDFTLKDADLLRPLLSRKRTIQKLSSSYETVVLRVSQAGKRKKKAQENIKNIDDRIAQLPVPENNDGLLEAVKLVRNKGKIDEDIKQIGREITSGKKNCNVDLKRLGLWSGDLGQLLELTLPLTETVRTFESRFSELDQDKRQLKKDLKRITAELKAAQTDNKEILYGGEVPSEKSLESVRNKREDGWQILRKKWIDCKDVSAEVEAYEPGCEIHESYERNVEQADLIADRLRREADRVAKSAALKARIESYEEELQAIIRQEEDTRAREEHLAVQWHTEWERLKIKPLSPREMLAWLAGIDKLRFQVSEIFIKEDEKTEKVKERQELRNTLIKVLGEADEIVKPPDDELGPLLVCAESILDDLSEDKARRKEHDEKQAATVLELNEAAAEKGEADIALKNWQVEWDNTLSVLDLEKQVTPDDALDILETLNNCLNKLEQAKDYQSRINGIERDINVYQDDLKVVLEQAAPELKELPSEQAVLKLHALLSKSLQDDELQKQNNEEMEVLAEELESGYKRLHSLQSLMAELLQVAHCHKKANLNEAIRKSVEFLRIREKVSNAESSLAKVSEGLSGEEIKRQAGDVDIDGLPARIAALERQIEQEINPEIEDTLKLIGEESKEIQLMDGSSRAAQAAEKMEQVAARIKRLVHQFARAKLAAVLLQNEIERYREEHQGPVLQLASKYFSKLTLGSFAGLRADIDDNGNPVMIGMRPDESRVGVEGMSDGTCDQLYLALRLATLKSRLENNEPMPFIVDDILINFDDARSRATLALLADLSVKNQVILFTHHRRIVDEAVELNTESEIVVHEL